MFSCFYVRLGVREGSPDDSLRFYSGYNLNNTYEGLVIVLQSTGDTVLHRLQTNCITDRLRN